MSSVFLNFCPSAKVCDWPGVPDSAQMAGQRAPGIVLAFALRIEVRPSYLCGRHCTS